MRHSPRSTGRRPARRLLPYGIYSIPELSFVGPTERELTEDAVPYVVGVAATASSPAARSPATARVC